MTSGAIIARVCMIKAVGRTHGAPYRGYGYVPLRLGGGGGGGGVVRRMGTQQQ